MPHIILQLKVGHGAIGTYLAQTEAMTSPPSVAGGVVKQNSLLNTYTPSADDDESNGFNTGIPKIDRLKWVEENGSRGREKELERRND